MNTEFNINVITALPEELIIKIFSYLKPINLKVISLTCIYFARLAQDNSLWKNLTLTKFPYEKITDEIVDKKFYKDLTRLDQKIDRLKKWINFHNYKINDEDFKQPTKKIHENLVKQLEYCYYEYINQDYFNIEKIFRIPQFYKNEYYTIDNDCSVATLPEEEHDRALKALLIDSIKLKNEIKINYDPNLNCEKSLTSNQLNVLSEVLQQTNGLIKFSLTNAGLQQDEIEGIILMVKDKIEGDKEINLLLS